MRPSQSHWILAKFANEELNATPLDKEPEQKPPKFDEQYYDPFAKWLKSVEEEVNESIVVDGETFNEGNQS